MSKKKYMRVLFIAPSAYLLGGVQDWLYMVCTALREYGHCVEIGVPDGSFHKLREYNEFYQGLNAKGFRNMTRTHEGRVRCLSRFLSQNKADIIVGVNIGDLYDAYMRNTGVIKRSRLVMTIHAIEANYFADAEVYAPILDGIVTTNRLSEKMIKGLGENVKKKVFYAPYGVVDSACSSREIIGSPLRIVWAGRLEIEQKRVCDLKGIVRSLDNKGISYTLSIAGDGPCMENLRSQLSEWIKRGKVKLLGFLAKGELQQLYQESDVLLITSTWETGPIVAWEAMAAGVLVVSSRYVGSYAENSLIHEQTALLFNIGDVEGAARQVVRVNDRVLVDKLRTNASAMVARKYLREVAMRQWEEVFLKICSTGRQQELRQQKEVAKPSSGRIESVLGSKLSERLRYLFPGKEAKDPGSEWPHSLRGLTDQNHLLNYAKEIEKTV